MNSHKSKVWSWSLGAAVFFLVCGLSFWAYWIMWGQYHERTEDAYVNGNMVMVMPFEDGVVKTIFVDNAQIVEAGQPLVELDTHDFLIAFDREAASLADTVREVAKLFYKVEELRAKQVVAEADLIRARLDYEHRKALVEDASVSREDFEHSETALAAAAAHVTEVVKELEGTLALVENTTVATHPKVEHAKAALRKAFLALHRCIVVAPARGLIGQRKVQVGQWVRATDSLMALVPLDQVWVDANYREVSLRHLRIGQPVEITSDMYGTDVTFHGHVVGLNPGTGSVFSILPPQNATGNWIKIIQRVPVKISLSAEEIASHPLVLGLSMTTHVDTHNRMGKRLPENTAARPIYTTAVYDEELEGAEQVIAAIIADNMP